VVRKPENIERVAYWKPRNAWMLWENKPQFNNPSPVIYHYDGYDENGENLNIMLSYRVSEVTYAGFAQDHIFTGEGEIDNNIDKPEKKGRGCKVITTDLKNTFGNNALITDRAGLPQ
jgi:hypothetical protein